MKEKTSQLGDEYKKEIDKVKQSYITKLTSLKQSLSPSMNANRNITTTSNITTINNINTIVSNAIQLSSSPKEKKNNIHLINYTSNNQSSNENTQMTDDDIITKIKQGTIYDSIVLNYIIKSSTNFEDNVNNLKAVYETKVDTLEKTMDYYKSYIENFYRKKIQQTRNTNMESVVLIEGNLPIMQITSEHNDTLKRLRELYDIKIKELETTFFSTLRAITAKRMDDMSSK